VRRDIQRRLATSAPISILSPIQADALMLSGYLMTRSTFTSSIKHFPLSTEPDATWRFRSIEPLATSANEFGRSRKAAAGTVDSGRVWGKPYQASKRLRYTGIFCLVVVLAIGGWLSRPVWNYPLGTIAGAAIVLVLARFILNRLHYHNSLIQVLASIPLCCVGSLLLSAHFRWIEPYYLRFGPKIPRFDKMTAWPCLN